MASALQCPACGHKHRLSELTGDPIFSCEQCGRLLKTPVEYRRPEPSAPAEAPRPTSRASRAGSDTLQRGGSATRDRTGTMPAAGASADTATADPPRTRRRSTRAPATLAVPLQILGWVAAFVIGGIIVRYLARWTGLLTGDSVIDLITGSGVGRYLRLFAVVPIWALVSAGLMTLFVEGARWWSARDAAKPATRPTARATTMPPAAKPVRPVATNAAPPPPLARPPASSPSPSPSPAAVDTRSPSGAASTPRARRIPKRDISSET